MASESDMPRSNGQDNWDNLWALLTVITLRKRGHNIEYSRAALSRGPSPAEVAGLRYTLGELLHRLPERDRLARLRALLQPPAGRKER